MPSFATEVAECLYVLNGRRGRRYVIYSSEAIGAPIDLEPGRWFFMPYPAPLGFRPGNPLDSAEAAERAALDWDDRFRDGG